MSLAGTLSNCAGGLTPWRTWLTCEETEALAGGAFTKDHGYVFEVDPFDTYNNLDPQPITGMGRFAHEAVAVDPKTGTVYLTEDASNPHGLVYRFVPNTPLGGYGSLPRRRRADRDALLDGSGRSCPTCRCSPSPARSWRSSGSPSPTRPRSSAARRASSSITAAIPTPPGGPDHQVTQVRGHVVGGRQGVHRHVVRTRSPTARSASTTARCGATTRRPATLRLEVWFAVNPDESSDLPDGPDNITVSPYGGLILAEDGDGVQHLYAVSERR